MYCGSCLRDGALAAALKRLGHDVVFIPTYTPLKIEAENVAVDQIFYGGVNVYLQQLSRFFRHTPRFLDRFLDAKGLLRWVSKLGQTTSARDLARLTLSVLRGEEGNQAKELHRLIEWLATQERPEVVVLPNSLFAGLAGPLRRRLGAPVLCQVAGEDMFVEDFPEPWRTEVRRELKRQVAGLDAILARTGTTPVSWRIIWDCRRRGFGWFRSGLTGKGMPPGRPSERPFRGNRQRGRNPPGERRSGIWRESVPRRGFMCWPRRSGFCVPGPRRQTAGCGWRGTWPGVPEVFRTGRVGLQAWGLSDCFEYVGELDAAGTRRFLGELDVVAGPGV